MEPIKGKVKSVQGRNYLVVTEVGDFLLDPYNQRRLTAVKPKLQLTLLSSANTDRTWKDAGQKRSVIAVGQEVYILSQMGRATAPGIAKLARNWALASDFEAVAPHTKPQLPDLFAVLALYEELVERAAETPRDLSRRPVFIEVASSEALRLLKLQRAFFCLDISNEELDRFALLGATRVDLSKEEIVVEGTPDGAVEVVPYHMSNEPVRRVYGILSYVSFDLIAWNPKFSRWDALNIVKVRMGRRQLDKKTAIGLRRQATNELVQSRFSNVAFQNLHHKFLLLGDGSSARFRGQELPYYVPKKRSS